MDGDSDFVLFLAVVFLSLVVTLIGVAATMDNDEYSKKMGYQFGWTHPGEGPEYCGWAYRIEEARSEDGYSQGMWMAGCYEAMEDRNR